MDFFIERMMVLGRGLVFQPVLATHTCTYNSNNIITSQNIEIADFPSKQNKTKNYKKMYIPTPPPPPLPNQQLQQQKKSRY